MFYAGFSQETIDRIKKSNVPSIKEIEKGRQEHIDEVKKKKDDTRKLRKTDTVISRSNVLLDDRSASQTTSKTSQEKSIYKKNGKLKQQKKIK